MKIVENLMKIVGSENVSTDPVVVKLHSMDAIGKEGKAFAVVFPESTEQVSEVVKLCNERSVKIFPQGSSTEVSGSYVPNDGLLSTFQR